ncbi:MULTISPECIES: hypothetical protein [Legionella]|uniref:Substrate of the Dot/Icm secretion system n=1 Tax=Legionella resiliens TaxID=2905958 RepID=A0ABS8X2V5_9GAMM|nr:MULTISPECIES: hypothetical protein [unclassified Legionella]MCE0722085.1 hypothetical protein [Legionella sp. 9fVS26]MCE3531239.1 hypothetical protein [Legionella sp. 8cVS16]QLZ67249.1 hypothetical protein FOLKNPGA_00014 [Legionella sp. PC1000]
MRHLRRVSSMSPCRRAVLQHLYPDKGWFSRDLPRITHSEHLKPPPAAKVKVSYKDMLHSLPKDPDMVHRGMAGLKEAENIAQDGRLGAGKYQKRPKGLNVAEFIFDPTKSCFLLSTSPDPHTVKEYTIGFQLIQAKGTIASMCLPPVYIRPQTARHIDIEQFEHFQTVLAAEVEMGNRTRLENIFDLADGNNETTAILGATEDDDWRPLFDLDVHSMMIVQAAGRIWSGFAKADDVETTTFVNPNFRKRIMSLEVFSTITGQGALYEKYLAKMNERARGFGLIDKDSRILTLHDASYLMSSAKYMATLDLFKATDETIALKGVPKGVTGEELVEYAISVIRDCPKKEQVTEVIDEHTQTLSSS